LVIIKLVALSLLRKVMKNHQNQIKMICCVECGEEASSLYIAYSPTNIRLLRCSSCQSVLDKYLEYDIVIVFIDLVLLKSPAYRHILFNTPKFTHVWRLALVMLLLDVYVRWFRIEKVIISLIFQLVVWSRSTCSIQSRNIP
jgi:hypothetical protein